MSEQYKPLDKFCRMVRARATENRKAFELLYEEGLLSPAIAIIRQELDSLVRVIYLLSISDIAHRERLMRATIDGQRWTDEKGKLITDSLMVKFADKLHGWDKLVYQFGCSFIHLSNYHDYHELDPLSMISNSEKNTIFEFIRKYYGNNIIPPNPKFDDIISVLPLVFNKIAENLRRYLEDLEEGKTLSLTEQS